jgi:hypothetical protein
MPHFESFNKLSPGDKLYYEGQYYIVVDCKQITGALLPIISDSFFALDIDTCKVRSINQSAVVEVIYYGSGV